MTIIRSRADRGCYPATGGGTMALADVIIWGNKARVSSGLFNTRRAILAWRRPEGADERA